MGFVVQQKVKATPEVPEAPGVGNVERKQPAATQPDYQPTSEQVGSTGGAPVTPDESIPVQQQTPKEPQSQQQAQEQDKKDNDPYTDIDIPIPATLESPTNENEEEAKKETKNIDAQATIPTDDEIAVEQYRRGDFNKAVPASPYPSAAAGASLVTMADANLPNVTPRPNPENATTQKQESIVSCLCAMLCFDPELGLDDATMPARLLMQEYRMPESSVRNIVTSEIERRRQEKQFASINQRQLDYDDDYATAIIMAVFDGRIPFTLVLGPATEQASYRCAYVRADNRDGIFIHPLANGIANGYFNSDEAAIFFDTDTGQARTLPRASDMLIDQNGKINFKIEVWSPGNWGSDEAKALERLKSVLSDQGIQVQSQGSRCLTRLARALYRSTLKDDPEVNIEVEVANAVKIVMHMANHNFFAQSVNNTSYTNKAEAISDVIRAIWEANTDIKYVGEALGLDSEESTVFGTFFDTAQHTRYEDRIQ